jgi:hypothetical protein
MKSIAALSVLLLVLVVCCLSVVRAAEQQATAPKTARSLADNYLCPRTAPPHPSPLVRKTQLKRTKRTKEMKRTKVTTQSIG